MLCPMNRTLASYLSEALKRRGWSRRTLAMYADVAPDTVAGAVRGDRVPDPDTIRKLATALGADEAHLLRLAGHLEDRPHELHDPQVIDLARRLEGLPQTLRMDLMRSIAAQVEMAELQAERQRLIDEAFRLFPDDMKRIYQQLEGSNPDNPENAPAPK